jgi:PiT family inorganic phosphate transporter
MLTLTILIIVVALVFDFLNGMNDAANSIATIVSTRVLSPRLAVLWAAFFNFAAAFGFGVHVANTIGKGIVDTAIVSPALVLAALLSAVVWTHLCTQYGLPISVSHALIGGMAGAGVAKAGTAALIVPSIVKVALFIVISPVLGLVLGLVLMICMHWIFRNTNPWRVDRLFRVGQLLSSATFSLGHGTNDAQKTMGIIAVLLFANGYIGEVFYVPWWVIIVSYFAISIGTLTGGWRVIRTMGVRLTDLRPVGGFCAESAGAVTLIGTALYGIPVSTTHTIAGAIMGVGSTKRLSAVRWGVAGKIVWAWVLTIPLSALGGILAYTAVSLFVD